MSVTGERVAGGDVSSTSKHETVAISDDDDTEDDEMPPLIQAPYNPVEAPIPRQPPQNIYYSRQQQQPPKRVSLPTSSASSHVLPPMPQPLPPPTMSTAAAAAAYRLSAHQTAATAVASADSHICLACHQPLRRQSESIVTCHVCQYHYHLPCIDVTAVHWEPNKQRLICARHRCHTCQAVSALFICLSCPRSFCPQHVTQHFTSFDLLPPHFRHTNYSPLPIHPGCYTATFSRSILAESLSAKPGTTPLTCSGMGVCRYCQEQEYDERIWRERIAVTRKLSFLQSSTSRPHTSHLIAPLAPYNKFNTAPPQRAAGADTSKPASTSVSPSTATAVPSVPSLKRPRPSSPTLRTANGSASSTEPVYDNGNQVNGDDDDDDDGDDDELPPLIHPDSLTNSTLSSAR